MRLRIGNEILVFYNTLIHFRVLWAQYEKAFVRSFEGMGKKSMKLLNFPIRELLLFSQAIGAPNFTKIVIKNFTELNIKSVPFEKHKLSPSKLITRGPMETNTGIYEPCLIIF